MTTQQNKSNVKSSSTKQTPILTLENVSFAYPQGSLVVEDVTFTLYQEDCLALMGPNGGGKSTLVKLIMGLLPPSSGSIRVFDQSPKIGRNHIGYLSQYTQIDLSFPIQVEEIVLMSQLHQSLFKRYTEEDRELANECMKSVGIHHLRHRSIGELSGGEKQRVFLARVLMNKPKLLILDEPTTSVDMHMEHDFYDLLKTLHQDMAILLISHDLSAVSHLVNKIACINRTFIYHGDKQLSHEDLATLYDCPIDLIAHGIPHRHLKGHDCDD